MLKLTMSIFQTEIQHRVNDFANAKEIVKQQFIGIDDVIDRVFDSLAQWYILPEIITQPIIINLFSLSGQGKTSLVRAISEALNLHGRYVEFDFAQDKDQNIIYTIDRCIGPRALKRAREKPIMFLCDEIQKGNTIDKNGDPLKTTGNQDYWTLISDGKIPSSSSKNFYLFKEIVLLMKQHDFPLELLHIGSTDLIGFPLKVIDENLEIDKAATKLKMKDEDNNLYLKISEDTLNVYKSIGKRLHSYNSSQVNSSHQSNRIHRLFDNLNEFVANTPLQVKKSEFAQFDITDLANIVSQIEEQNIITPYYDLSKSVIFNCANLDSLYAAKAVGERRIDADYFRKQTESITINDVKYALGKLFRPEQVARFGNTLISYLAFSCDDYRRIIKQKLEQFCQLIEQETHGFKVIVDASVEELVYNNGIYPAQGTRPVYSTINQIQSLASQLVLGSLIEGHNSGTLSYDYENKSLLITSEPGFKLSSNYVGDHDNSTRKIDKNLLTKNSVDIAAQIVVYINLFNVFPQRVAASYNKSNNLFVAYPINQSKNLLLKQITFEMVTVASQIKFFGEKACIDQTSKSATTYAANYVRFKGLGKRKAVMNSISPALGLVEYHGTDDEIMKLVDNGYEEALLLVEKYFDTIKKLAITIYEAEGEVTQEMIHYAIKDIGLFPQAVSDDHVISEEYESILFKDSLIEKFNALHVLKYVEKNNFAPNCSIDCSHLSE
jgi:hypothetical protein